MTDNLAAFRALIAALPLSAALWVLIWRLV